MKFDKAGKSRLTLSSVPRESGAVDRLLDNSRQVLRLDLIDDNPRNPRTMHDRGDDPELRDLAESIAAHGLLQAPVVRRHPEDPDRYVVVLGQRRVAAHRLLKRDEIEVIVRRLDDRQAFLASCVENVQRVALSPREEMDMVGVLIDELGSQEAAARALGKSPTWLSKRKRVLTMPGLAAMVERGEISLDHAYDILTRAPDESAALAQAQHVRAGRQSQAETRRQGAVVPPAVPDVPAAAERPTLSDRNQARAGILQPTDMGVEEQDTVPSLSARNWSSDKTERDEDEDNAAVGAIVSPSEVTALEQRAEERPLEYGRPLVAGSRYDEPYVVLLHQPIIRERARTIAREIRDFLSDAHLTNRHDIAVLEAAAETAEHLAGPE